MASKIRRTLTIGHMPDGRPIKKNFCGKTKKEVNKKIDDYKIRAATGQLELQEDIPLSMWAEEWLSTYKDGNVSENTYDMYRLCVKHIANYFGSALISCIRPIDIQELYKTHKEKSQSFLNKLKITLNAIFETAIANGYACGNPVKGTSIPTGKAPEEKHVWTAEQTDAAFSFAIGHRFGIGPAIILKTGLRRGELMGLMPLFDIDIENGRLSVRRTVTDVNGVVSVKDGGKSTSALRTIPLDAQCVEWMKQEKQFQQDGYLFRTLRGKSIGSVLSPRRWYQKRFIPFMDDLVASTGLPALSPHELRHTYGTLLYDAGTDIYTIQKVMGHADIKVTAKTYVHGSIEAIENNIKFPNAQPRQSATTDNLFRAVKK